MKTGIIYCAYNKVNNKRYIGQTIQRLSERKSAHYTKNGCPYFHHALLKYKAEDWEWTIIDQASTKEELNQKEKYWIAFYETTNPEKGYNISSGGDGSEQTLEQIQYARNRFIELYGSIKKNTTKKQSNIRCIETGEVFKTAAAAGRAKNITYSHICEAANGILSSAGGYHWEWCFDITFFPNAIYCKELDKIYLNYNDARNTDNFSGNKLSQAFKTQGSPCTYAGYTFYKINE